MAHSRSPRRTGEAPLYGGIPARQRGVDATNAFKPERSPFSHRAAAFTSIAMHLPPVLYDEIHLQKYDRITVQRGRRCLPPSSQEHPVPRIKKFKNVPALKEEPWKGRRRGRRAV